MIDAASCKCGSEARMTTIKRKTGNGEKKFYSICCSSCKKHTHTYSSKTLVRQAWRNINQR